MNFRSVFNNLKATRHYANRVTRYNTTKGKSGVRPPSFSFGNFSKLADPDKKQVDQAALSVDRITDFHELKIFPSVRVSMMEEIKSCYNFKNTYLKSKDEVEIKPTPVQVASVRKINKSRNVKVSKFQDSEDIYNEMIENFNNKLKVFTVAAETGSGKTWAYLSVILSKLKEDDLASFTKNPGVFEESRKLSKVRSVILLPTNELVDQVSETLNAANSIPLHLQNNVPEHILKDTKYKSFLEMEDQNGLSLNILKWGAGEPASKFFNALNKTVDVLITTPTKLQSLGKQHSTESNPYRYLYNVSYCVVDEADTLFDPSWVNDTTAILSKFSKCKDVILCSATMPKRFVKTVEKFFGKSVINVITPSLHKVPKQVNVKVIDAELSPFNGSKTRCLAQALYAIQKDGSEKGFVKRVIVFVNHKKDVLPLVSVLATKYHQENDSLIGLSGDDSPLERAEKIKPFIHHAESLENPDDDSRLQVLVTTDLFARGVNFSAVKNVILMDFPNNSVDLIHRMGRTGRMKQSGRVFIITDKKSRKSWIKSLPNATKQGIRIG
ncbi:RNA helicase [Yamadazyma tenuis]|uniref:ATP-dependent RNA helicase n=1 Tax=Candida tenuis (strain ATCC 10573 / BCRC 21748 / CBS 615 / JCM 9827 / NBRC 10315 / NRRL Y-1498 / VKM Y-70) TaxID=590646 RepID=G3BAE9_CANTC|nr:uncharacterized protein CANTEDRAFT_108273 [Yamadazyma tenuis ATCC 10573]EGV62045.1 hypothetical protein CANTEDRAFT_108273 [Yamadazyma tenuis ATCC 10573]WEJ93291.1 RNA helicase [Yamadazyma tenuis]